MIYIGYFLLAMAGLSASIITTGVSVWIGMEIADVLCDKLRGRLK